MSKHDIQTVTEAMRDTTISSCATTITIECGSHDTKDAILDFLTSDLGQLLWPAFEDVAKWTGEMAGAATLDLRSADASEVGLNGVSIVEWRKAYLEGCRDMANGVLSRAPEAIRTNFEKTAMTAFYVACG